MNSTNYSVAGKLADLFAFRRRMQSVETPTVTFADVGGEDRAKETLQDVVDFLRHPENYRQAGARAPQRLLLVGPVGTGKTLLAQAVAGEAGTPLFYISAAQIVGVNRGDLHVLAAFERAKSAAPAIILIDDIDIQGQNHVDFGVTDDQRTLYQLATEMNHLDTSQPVVVFITARQPDMLGPVLLRPGCFDRQVILGLPDRPGRETILGIHTRRVNLATDVNLALLARTTTGFSGADLAQLCGEAALVAARKAHRQVGMVDFESALDQILLGAARPILLYDHEREVVAYHEAGHALVAWLSTASHPVQEVTILPRRRVFGQFELLPHDGFHNHYRHEYLMARLSVLLAGRVAEEVALGEITTTAEDDLSAATLLARHLVTRWGMGSLGPMALRSSEPLLCPLHSAVLGRDYSETTAARIDEDIQRLLDERYQAVRDLLINARGMLESLAQALMKEEIIDQDAIVRILGHRPLNSRLEITPHLEEV